MLKKILLGEDNKIEADFIKFILNNYHNVELDHYDNGNSLYEQLSDINSIDYDLIIFDINMPGISGLDLISSVRDLGNLCPIIILSTSSEPKDINKAYILGANSYLIKPVDFNKFTKMFKLAITYWLQYNKLCYH